MSDYEQDEAVKLTEKIKYATGNFQPDERISTYT